MTKVYGRLLSRPTLLYKTEVSVGLKSWNLDGVAFREPKKLTNWACLSIRRYDRDLSVYDKKCKEILEKFQFHLKSKGIEVEDAAGSHDDLKITGQRDHQRLDEWFRVCRPEYRVNFLIVILPDWVTSELYNQIKRYGDVKHGIHTVCVKYEKFKFGDSRYVANVALVSPSTFLFKQLTWT